MARATTEVVTPVAERDAGRNSYVDWAAIIAGAVIAAAVSMIMLTFGGAVGLSFASPFRGEGISLTGLAIASALWLLWVQVSSFAAGGYVAGRMRRRMWEGTPHEAEVRDGIHGVSVWAVGAIVSGLIAASTVSGVVKTGAQVAATTAAGAATALGAAGGAAAAEGNGQGGQQATAAGSRSGYIVDTLFRTDDPAAASPPPDSEAARQEVGRILAFSATQGSVSAEDRAYVARVVAARTGMTQEQAEQRVNDALARADAIARDAERKAREAADAARKAGAILGFITAATMLIAAGAAWWAASAGGRHRDEGTDFSSIIGRRRVVTTT